MSNFLVPNYIQNFLFDTLPCDSPLSLKCFQNGVDDTSISNGCHFMDINTVRYCKIYRKSPFVGKLANFGMSVLFLGHCMGHFCVTHRETNGETNRHTDGKVVLHSCIAAAKNGEEIRHFKCGEGAIIKDFGPKYLPYSKNLKHFVRIKFQYLFKYLGFLQEQNSQNWRKLIPSEMYSHSVGL